MHSNKQAAMVRVVMPVWEFALQRTESYIARLSLLTLDPIMADLPIIGPLQLAYFWFKNRTRRKLISRWAASKGLNFAPDANTFDPPKISHGAEDASHVAPHSDRARRIFSRLMGISKVQASYPQFAANRFRGDWQVDKNICWGELAGHTVIVWDTLFYDIMMVDANNDDWTEGMYTSILVLTDTPLHRTLIAPNSLFKRLSAFGIEEGRGTFSMSTVKFELEAFNKAYRVRGRDRKWTVDIIDQGMIDWLMENKNHTMELAPGGAMVSTWFTLTPDAIESQLKFCGEFLKHIPEDLQHASSQTDD
jgi:hypothetical protein